MFRCPTIFFIPIVCLTANTLATFVIAKNSIVAHPVCYFVIAYIFFSFNKPIATIVLIRVVRTERQILSVPQIDKLSCLVIFKSMVI